MKDGYWRIPNPFLDEFVSVFLTKNGEFKLKTPPSRLNLYAANYWSEIQAKKYGYKWLGWL